mmetsp:Transcript_43765/g.103414  ORF Transcript_43765/g.103414 Transcript_43765/m.103414 type:complete len:255 (-) Transcript_43765:28-792(-)
MASTVLICLGAFLAIVLQGCDQEYDVSMTYTCSNQVADNVCTEWRQVGSVKVPGSSCLPGKMHVITATGSKPLSELTVGEEILGYDHEQKAPVFTVVRAWLHRDANSVATVTAVSTADAGTIQASAKHPFAVAGGSRYEFAADLREGLHHVMLSTNMSTAVLGVTSEEAVGLYAPLTMTSNFFVSGDSGKSAILAHSLAHMKAPRRYELPLHAAFTVFEALHPSGGSDSSSQGSFVHPVARLLMRSGGHLLMSQ